MRRLHHVLYTHLPDWAQPANPVLRYLMCRRQPRGHRWWRWFERVGGIMCVVGLVVLGWMAQDADTPFAVRMACDLGLLAALYFPLLLLQSIAVLLALLWGSSVISEEQQRGTWEGFRVTSYGAEKLVYARWAALFYRMRTLLVLLLVPRVLFAGLAVAAVTDYQGHYLDLYAMGIAPQVPLGVDVIMLTALVIAVLVQIPVLMGLNVALGILISVIFPKRAVAGLVRSVVCVGEIGLLGLAFHALQSMTYTVPRSYAGQTWANLLLIEALGDQGLRFMDLRTFLQTWTDVQYGSLLGGALLAAVVVQILATRGVLAVAGRLVARPLPV